MLLVLLLGALPGTALAIPGDDVDPELPDPIFEAPANGFAWNVPDRFADKGDGRFDWKWNADVQRYDHWHVHPDSWPMRIYGCQTEADLTAAVNGQPTAHTYVFESADGQRIEGRNCHITVGFPEEAKYDVRWSARRDDGSLLGSWSQTVEIKDHLIVSMGDSYGSGEGAPEYNRPSGATWGRWVDSRCHRSSFAGAPQAARAIEQADPHASVTFLGFACSGATISREYHGYSEAHPDDKHDPWKPGDPALNNGSGILGPYRGLQPPDDNPDDKIPSQVDQLVTALTDGAKSPELREVDALIVSAGGNDASFGPLASACVIWDDCRHPDLKAFTGPDGGKVTLEERVGHDLSTLPGRYAAFASALDSLETAVGVDIAGTYVTEYPDPGTEVRDGRVVECGYILDDIIATMEMVGYSWPERAHGTELGYARKVFLPTVNGHLRDAAAAHGWRYVDGINDGFQGHGYCVGARGTENSDRFVQTAILSTDQQGPMKPMGETETKGLLHPNKLGYKVYRDRILAHLRPDLALRGPDGGRHHRFPLPTTTATTTPEAPASGWHTGSVEIRIDAAATGGGAVAAVEHRLGNDELWGRTSGATATRSLTEEGTWHVGHRAVDSFGNRGPAQVLTVRIDRTAPQVVCEGADGRWHPGNVSLGCTATDSGSGLADGDRAFTLSTSVGGGEETADAPSGSREICDVAGNCTTAEAIGGNRVDRRGPDITLDVPAGPHTLGDAVPGSYSCADAGSGIASCEGTAPSGALLDTATPGTKSLEVVAVDGVGNRTTRTVTYEVHFPFGGLTGPVSAPPTINQVNGGSAVPVQFSLDGDRGLDVVAAGSPTSRPVACDPGAPHDAVEETVDTVGPALSYDAATDTYSLRWKTDRSWNGTCRQLTIELVDGSRHSALFRFGK